MSHQADVTATFDPAEAIRLLLGLRTPQFRHEAAIRLFQFETWILDSQPGSSSPMKAACVAAAEFLDSMANRKLASRPRSHPRAGAVSLSQLLERSDYRLLFDATLGRAIGWKQLALSTSDFNERINTLPSADTTIKMMDYMFRYRDHGGKMLRAANISHAMYYVWSDEKAISGKTIKARWGETKNSAVFLYVNNLPKFSILEVPIGGTSLGMSMLDHLTMRAKRVKDHCHYFGACAYVAEAIGGDIFEAQANLIPKEVPRIRPRTKPLSGPENDRMLRYKDEYEDMRNSMMRDY